MTVARLIRVLQRVPVEGVVYGRSGEARGCAVVTALYTGAVVACFVTPAPVGIIDGF